MPFAAPSSLQPHMAGFPVARVEIGKEKQLGIGRELQEFMVQLVRETQAETEERVCVPHRRMVLHSPRRGAATSVCVTALGLESGP